MSTKMEDFIKEHKKEFDTDRPSAGLWDKIEAGLELEKKNKRSPVKLRMWMSVAASLMVLLGITFGYYRSPLKTGRMSVADVNSDYGEKQVRFTSLIEQKRDSLQNYAQENPELYKKFSSDLKQLNASYETLQKELPKSPNQQLVVKAMIKNLEIQLQLVSQQLSIISEVNQYKKENSI